MSNRLGELHVIPGLAPVSATGALYGDVINMEGLLELEIDVLAGVVGSSQTITVEECDNVTPDTPVAIAYTYQKSSAVGTDTMGAVTLISGTAGTTMEAGTILRIFIQSADLSAGYPFVRVKCTSSGTCLIAAMYIARDRYPREIPVSAIA